MITMFDVYISAENKINGEADLYGILGVDSRVDDDMLRKQYRKLALRLHPDKNKSVDAVKAFSLISEAWRVLSDKAKRETYDEKINAKAPKISTKTGRTSPRRGASGSDNFTKTATSSARTQKKAPKEHASTFSYKAESTTFWTVCNQCQVRYEYLRVYLNFKLMCCSCGKAFQAVEAAPPPSVCATSWNCWKDKPKVNHQGAGKSKSTAGKNTATANVGASSKRKTDSHNPTNLQQVPFSRAPGASSAAQAANVKRKRVELQAATKRKQHVAKTTYFNPDKRRRGMEDTSLRSHDKDTVNQTGGANGVVGASNSCKAKKGNFESTGISGITKTSSGRDIYQLELQNLLMKKSIKEICKKLRELQSNTFSETALKESVNGYQKADEKSEGRMSGSQVAKSFADTAMANILRKALGTMAIDVPDPHFHDFDKDRTERSFGENQVWVAYDDDGLPSQYAMIHNVISVNPFKMQLNWLNPITNADELGPLNRVASGFSKTCGDFRVGRSKIINSPNFFSHMVKWRKGNGGAVSIYPRRGDVWTLYRNWSPDWDELTDYDVIHKYDMVEVLENFNEQRGVIVATLVKVAGFRTLFHRHLDLGEVRLIPREEMSRFSHQVPSYLLNGQEAPNAPKGCLELDPAATPFDLLQVIEVAKEEDWMNNEDTINNESANGDMKEANGEDIMNDT
ncbi:hypothetical protein RIF29_21682 [Crotalaria pallida]|uniref:J domain-containing protein n=1 Tax=Crotalaria pallida TaxID=3830 RepID=A0AAN9F5S9_CROPI